MNQFNIICVNNLLFIRISKMMDSSKLDSFQLSKCVFDPVFGTRHKRQLSYIPKYNYYKAISNIKSKYPNVASNSERSSMQYSQYAAHPTPTHSVQTTPRKKYQIQKINSHMYKIKDISKMSDIQWPKPDQKRTKSFHDEDKASEIDFKKLIKEGIQGKNPEQDKSIKTRLEKIAMKHEQESINFKGKKMRMRSNSYKGA